MDDVDESDIDWEEWDRRGGVFLFESEMEISAGRRLGDGMLPLEAVLAYGLGDDEF